MRPETTNYRAVLDMYRSAARLGAGERDWPAAALWLLNLMRVSAGRYACMYVCIYSMYVCVYVYIYSMYVCIYIHITS